MMLITLEQFAEVPAKIHLFYEYAFEALFGRHDATKVGFQRKRHTSLALDDFKRLFSYFCMITYVRDKKVFSRDRVLEVIQQSIRSSQIEAGKSEFLNDLTETACVLVRDGLDYTFSHRSFQEYFAAYFLSRVKAEEFERALPNIVRRSAFDNVLKMVSEMNNEKFEEVWALPVLNALCERVRGIDARANCVGFASRLLDRKLQLIVSEKRLGIGAIQAKGEGSSLREESGEYRTALYGVYELFERIREMSNYKSADDVKVIKLIADGEILADDQRFDFLRQGKKRPVSSPIKLKRSDSSWLRDTEVGQFIIAESKFLPKFRDEMARRVQARAHGLSKIFPN